MTLLFTPHAFFSSPHKPPFAACLHPSTMAKRRRKNHTHVTPTDENAAKVPKSFVMRSGPVGRAVSALVKDLRRVMEPNTASKLRERQNNKLKDFIMVAGQLGITHFMILSRTNVGTNLRIARLPRGPTLTFRVVSYSLARDVLGLQKNPLSPGAEYHTSPLLVLNNFGSDKKEFKLMSTMFQNLFPSINVQTMQLADARRVILLNYNSDTSTIDFRHYSVAVKPIGVSKSVKRVISTHVPDLSRFADISEYVLREAQASESDVEDGGESTVTLAQDFVGRNNRKAEQRAIRLTEIGPRMELRLVKVQEGLCGGEVLFHEFVHKTPKELEQQQRERQQRKQETAVRRKQQEDNVERKRKEREEHRIKTGGKPREEGGKEEEEGEDREGSEEEDEDRGLEEDSEEEDGFDIEEEEEGDDGALFDEEELEKGIDGEDEDMNEDEDMSEDEDENEDEDDFGPASKKLKPTTNAPSRAHGKPRGGLVRSGRGGARGGRGGARGGRGDTRGSHMDSRSGRGRGRGRGTREGRTGGSKGRISVKMARGRGGRR